MNEDNMIISRTLDKISQCENKYITTSTQFLDGHQQSLIRGYFRKNHIPYYDSDNMAEEDRPFMRSVFYGGYEDAERMILVNLPDYAGLTDGDILQVISAKRPAGGKALTHRDYLGSLMGLGIKREMVGDILVREDGADIIVLAEIADYILMNYTKAGRTELSLDIKSIGELVIPPQKVTVITDTVASLRLDSVAASAFGLSRGKAADAIRMGLVFVNYVEAAKADMMLKEGDKLSLRGKGKAKLASIGGKSKKDRIYINIERYM